MLNKENLGRISEKYKNDTKLFITLLLLFSCPVVSDSLWSHRRQPTRLPHPWGSPGKSTEVGCRFLLLCMKVKSESEVSRVWLFATPWTAAYQAPPSMGFSRLRVLEWGAIAFSKTSFLLDPKCYGHTHSSELKWTVRATLVKTLHSCSKRPTK